MMKLKFENLWLGHDDFFDSAIKRWIRVFKSLWFGYENIFDSTMMKVSWRGFELAAQISLICPWKPLWFGHDEAKIVESSIRPWWPLWFGRSNLSNSALTMSRVSDLARITTTIGPWWSQSWRVSIFAVATSSIRSWQCWARGREFPPSLLGSIEYRERKIPSLYSA